MPPTLYLIDGHALAYRTYFALTRGGSSGFTTSTGEPTAGVFGFVSVLLRIFEQERPDFLAVAFDTGKTFRDDLFPEYKGTRAKMPDDLRSQIERIRQLVDAFNIPRLEVDNYEADDVLGSVARQAVVDGYGVKIITGDRDLLQLVDDRIIVNLPGRSLADAVDYMAEDVIEYFGVRPDQVVDYKALVGDKSDNIPGVAGIGKKTATSLLNSFNDLNGVYAHLEDVSPSVKKKLQSGYENALLSKELATIVTDLIIHLDLEKARPERFEPAQVEALFRELEFRSLMTRLNALIKTYGVSTVGDGGQLSLFGNQESPAALTPSDVLTDIVDTPDALMELVARLKDARVVAFDTETTSTDQMSAELVGISLAVDGDHAYYLPVGHRSELGSQLPIEIILENLREPMTDPHLLKVGHNLKYDFVMLARYGFRVSPLTFDTMIAEWLINPTSRNLGLKNLAWVRLNAHMVSIEELIGKGKKQISMSDVSIKQAADYAGADAAIVLQLMPQLQSELEERLAMNLFEEIEMPLIPVLADMEMTGIALDTQFLAGMSANLNVRVGEIETRIYESVGEHFNLNSPQQLSGVLFDRLRIPPPDRTRRTSSGYYSTAVGVLEELRGKHPVVDWVLEYRELSKLKSTYVDALPQQINPKQ